MDSGTINKYFSPVSRSVKRSRLVSPSDNGSDTADNMAGGEGKVGELTNTQLVSMLSELLDNKLDIKLANLATKQDIQQITGQVSKLAEENELLKQEVKKLKLQVKTFLTNWWTWKADLGGTT